MPVQSIECQLVRAQIGRYLGGEPLTQESMRQLEVHLVACDDCREALSSRKAELRAKMATEGATQKPRPNIDPQSISQKAAVDYKSIEAAAKAATQKSAAPQKPAKSTNFTKPLALTGVLAVVLVAMSRMSGGNGLTMGPNALAAFNLKSATPAATTQKATNPTPENAPTASKPTVAAPTSTPTTGTTSTTPPAATDPKAASTPPTASSSPSTSNPSAAPVASSTTTGTAAGSAPTSTTTPSSPTPTPTNTSTKTPDKVEAPKQPASTASVTPPAPKEETKKTEPVAEAPKPEAPVKPKRTAHKTRVHRAVRRVAAIRTHKVHKTPHHRPIARIRVYDASGAPIEQ